MLLLLLADGIVGMFLVAAFLRRGSRRLSYSPEAMQQDFRAVLESQRAATGTRSKIHLSKIHLVTSRPRQAAEVGPTKRSLAGRLCVSVLSSAAGAITFVMRQFWVKVLGARLRPRQSYAD